jgi:hypothetical protein
MKNKNVTVSINYTPANTEYVIRLKKTGGKWLWLLLLPVLLAAWVLLSNIFTIVTETGYIIDENIDDIEVCIENECDVIKNNDDDSVCAKKSLEQFFPPIKSQGTFGTCVAWATGYNMKTALNAIENGWSEADLKQDRNQTSPRDLWMSMAKKDCKVGSLFRDALDAIEKNGVASMSDVSYDKMEESCNLYGGLGDENNKIAKWRRIKEITVENLKGYLDLNMPVLFGGNVGDRFTYWRFPYQFRTNKVFDHDSDHDGGHAMVVVGYDDCRQAFRVRNSWGENWGDNGSIWVDYNYFIIDFCDEAYVATLHDDDNLEPTPESKTDLMISFAHDRESTKAGYRELNITVYNSGETEITPNPEWTIAYMLYNAKNAKEHYIISYDFVSTRYSGNRNMIADDDCLAENIWLFNFSLAPGENASTGYFDYRLPDNLNGKYYIIIVADVEDAIREVNERNNFWFIGDENSDPLLFENGKMLNKPAEPAMNTPSPLPYSDNAYQTPVKPGNLNAYTPGELKKLIQCELKKRRDKTKK